MMNRIALAALALAVVACTQPAEEDEDMGSTESRIVGGDPSSTAPGIGAVIVFDKGAYLGFCTGFLIAPQIVMSAGHCVAHSQDGTPSFFTGDGARVTTKPKTKADIKGFVEHPVKAMIAFPKYKGGKLDNAKMTLQQVQNAAADDFGLYELAAPLTRVNPLVLGPGTPANNEACVGIGYGDDSEGTTKGFLRKRSANMRARGPTQLWIEASATNGEPAQGDSGSPLLCGNNKVRGVYSFFYSDASRPTADRDFYANATGPDLREWVNKTAKSWGVAGIP